MVGCYMLMMPPRSSPTSTFSVADINNEVVCPLRNQDGSGCRKRCLGEKRFRSMQEHIRRAHPENYIPKLPATEESFRLMISTQPSDRTHYQNKSDLTPSNCGSDRKSYYGDNSSSPNTPINTPKPAEERKLMTTIPNISAATSLTQLHGHKLESDPELGGGWSSDTEAHRHGMRRSIEFSTPSIANYETRSDSFSPLSRRSELLPSILNTPHLERSSTLPPIQRLPSLNRPRKDSLSKRARDPQHKRNRSRGDSNHLWRVNFDRKTHSSEISNGLSVAWGKRWEDLIDAATSATKDTDENRLSKSPSAVESKIREPIETHVSSLPSLNRDSLPVFPLSHSYYQRYQASPLQQTLIPPTHLQHTPEPVKSIESGEGDKDCNYNTHSHPDSSLNFPSRSLQIYCAGCHGLSLLKQSYVCTECICGICEACVDNLMASHGARRKCPKCAAIGGRYKKINLDMR